MINYEGVIDYLDVLSNESRATSQLIDELSLVMKEIPVEDYENRLKLSEILEKTQKLQRNISGRRKLLLEIVTILKKAGIKSNDIVSGLEYENSKLINGG